MMRHMAASSGRSWLGLPHCRTMCSSPRQRDYVTGNTSTVPQDVRPRHNTAHQLSHEENTKPEKRTRVRILALSWPPRTPPEKTAFHRLGPD